MAGRIYYSHPVSPDLAKTIGAEVTSVEVYELTVDEERMAINRAGNSIGALASELALQSFRGVNRQPASLADGTRDTLWSRMHPKLRALVIGAHQEHHHPKAAEVGDFYKGVETLADG